MAKIPVGVVGATGLAGQQFLAALACHPLFELRVLAASERSAGKSYAEAMRDDKGASRWFCAERLAPELARLTVQDASKLDVGELGVVFSAVDGDAARVLEARYAEKTAVVSTASAYRYEDDVPILIPPVNASHLGLFERQRARRGWKGFITPIPNCTTTGLAISLAPLVPFGIELVVMTSMQACSGAGRSPGVIALDIVDNLVPYIPKEEEKVQVETRKILGTLGADGIAPHSLGITCTCTRTAVMEGHTESVFVKLKRPLHVEEAAAVMRSWKGAPEAAALPSAPTAWIEVSDDPYRPQPRLDRDNGGGMVTSVGRLRADPALENGLKYVLVSHNTKMGAARGAILVAELLAASGLVR